MKTPVVVAVVVAAVALGTTTGVALLPARDSGRASDPGASSARFDAGRLLTVDDLAAAGLPGRATVSRGAGEGGLGSSDCEPGAVLSDTAPLGSAFIHGVWKVGSQTRVREVASQVEDAKQSVRLARRVLVQSESCQDEPWSHWRYADARHVDVADGVTADWMSLHNGTDSGSGIGPACGGVAVVRNRARFGVVFVDWCARPAQVKQIATVAAKRLG